MKRHEPQPIATIGFIPNEFRHESEDMARRRLQQKGNLYIQAGYWKLRWREDQMLPDGSTRYGWSKPVVIGPAEGPLKLTEKQARRFGWDNFLSRLDQNMRTPQSIVTVAEFVDRKFVPERVAMLKKAGRVHYDTMLRLAIGGIPEKLPSFKGVKRGERAPEVPRRCGLGTLRLRDVRHEDVQRLIGEAILRGYSPKTARHLRTTVGTIFEYAEFIEWFSGRNPAAKVRLPEITARRTVQALGFDQLRRLLGSLDPAERTMVACASMTSMNVAEVSALRWKRVNLSESAAIVDGELIPEFAVAVREQWYRREFGSTKTKTRRRNVPLTSHLLAILNQWKMRQAQAAPDGLVFPGRDQTRPLDAGAALRRVRKAAAELGIPRIGWHDLRRTFSTLGGVSGMRVEDRRALMGHANAAMTLHYDQTTSADAREALERMSGLIFGEGRPN